MGSLHHMLSRFHLWKPKFYTLIGNNNRLRRGNNEVLKTKQLLSNLIGNPQFEILFSQTLKITEIIHNYLLKLETNKYFISDVLND